MQSGDTLGRWTLDGCVGQGASGSVWRAFSGTRTATIKICNPDNEKAAASMARERALLAGLAHANLPRLLETIEMPFSLVFDAAPAPTYGDLLAAGKLWQYPLGQRLNALTDIAGAVDFLHALGIIHRDIKPAHITSSTPPALYDFGIAQRADAANPPDENAGTAAYMPAAAEPLSPARDIYAFGITAYEMLFGAHPMLTAADRDISPTVLRERAARKVANDAWRRPSRIPSAERPPDLRGADMAALDALFAQMIGPAAQRPASLGTWMQTLLAAIPQADRASAVAPDSPPESFAPAHTQHEVSAVLQTDMPDSPRDWRIPLAAVGMLLLAALFLLTRG